MSPLERLRLRLSALHVDLPLVVRRHRHDGGALSPVSAIYSHGGELVVEHAYHEEALAIVEAVNALQTLLRVAHAARSLRHIERKGFDGQFLAQMLDTALAEIDALEEAPVEVAAREA